MKICPECGRVFDPAVRASPSADWGVERIVYCSVRCKRKAQNRRYYAKHRRIKHMLVDITQTGIAVLEGGAFEVASRTVYQRLAGVPAGRYFIGSSTPVKTIEELISTIAERPKRYSYNYPFITDYMSHYVADLFVDPMSVPMPMSDYGHIAVSSGDKIVWVRSANLRLMLRKVTSVSPDFDAAIIQNVRGAQALRLSARNSEVEIVSWVATQDPLSEWIP